MNGLQSCKPHLKYLPCKADTTALECGWHAVRDNALDLGFLIWIEGLGFRWTADSKRCRVRHATPKAHPRSLRLKFFAC
jgi:hypothetical protein